MADYTKVNTDDRLQGASNHTPATHTTDPRDFNEVSTDDSTKGSEVRKANCCLCLFPAASASEYKETLKQLTKLSWPLALYMIASTLLSMTSIIFSGHLGKDEIVAASLAQSVIHVFWRAIMIGFTSGADTLFAQTYGSKNKKRVGIIFQRFLVITTLLAVVCWGLLLNTEGILLLFGQDPRIARLASSYGMLYIAATPADTVFILLVKYVESQSIVRPVLVIIVILGGLNVLLHFITVSALHLGLVGAVGAQVITYYFGAIMTSGYIYFRNIYRETWPGWSWECLQEWRSILTLSIAGMIVIAVEWTSFEVGFFITGLLGKTEVGAHAVLFYISGIPWSISSGFGIGASIMIGNFLGAHKAKKAHLTACCGIIIGVSLGVLYLVVLIAVKDVIGYVFTRDTDVVHLVASVMPLAASNELFDSGNAVCYSILRGCGYQKVGAIVCFVGYLGGLSLGVVLMFKVGYGLKGMWLGILLALAVQFVLLTTFIVFFIKWDKEVIKAQKRAAVTPDATTKKSNGVMPLEPIGNDVDREDIKETSGGGDEAFERSSRKSPDRDLGDAGSRDGDRNEGVVGIKDADQFGLNHPGHDTGILEALARDHAECGEAEARPEDVCMQGKRKGTEGEEEDEGESVVQILTLNRLSLTQLILRRGLALFVSIVLFVVFVFVFIYVVPAVRPAIEDVTNSTTYSTTNGYFTDEF